MPRRSVKQQLIDRIRKELPFVPIDDIDDLIPIRGPKDGGQIAWESFGGFNRICSAETMRDLVKAKEICSTTPEMYNSDGFEIGSGKLTIL